MVLQFNNYLNNKRLDNTKEIFKIDDEIEFYPKMIESIYRFLIENNKYE